MARKRSKRPNVEEGLEIEIDDRNKATIIDPDEFMSGGYGRRSLQKYTDLYMFQFGAYGWTVLLIWEPGSLEDALEKAAEWLAEHAPGHIIEHGSKHLQELYKEAAQDLGLPWPLDEEDQARVDEAATADLTYTEAGYLTSYEWTFREIGTDDPLYLEAFEASFEHQQEELSEDEEERAQKLLEGLKQGRKENQRRRGKNPGPKAKLEWNWSWPVMGSHVPSNRHYEADAPIDSVKGVLHLFPAHDGWKVYWETTERYMSRMEGEGYASIGRVSKVAEGKRMAKQWYDATLSRIRRSENGAGSGRTRNLANSVARGGR